MSYELATIADPISQTSQPLPQREEKVLSAYGDSNARINQAIAKLQGKLPPPVETTDATNINDSEAGESAPGGASRQLSPQLAVLLKKEQKFRQEQAAFKKERAELEELRSLKAKIAAGDYSEADKLIDYEKFTQHKLGKDPKAEELAEFRAELAALKADRDKDVSDRFESAINQRRVAVKSLIASNEDYSTIKELKAEEAVVQLILDTWENEEVELSPDEAALMVEKELIERGRKWSSLKKLKSETTAETPEKKELPPLKTGTKTLTNNMASTGEIKRPSTPLHLMTEQERYAEARRRAEEKIKQGIRW